MWRNFLAVLFLLGSSGCGFLDLLTNPATLGALGGAAAVEVVRSLGGDDDDDDPPPTCPDVIEIDLVPVGSEAVLLSVNPNSLAWEVHLNGFHVVTFSANRAESFVLDETTGLNIGPGDGRAVGDPDEGRNTVFVRRLSCVSPSQTFYVAP